MKVLQCNSPFNLAYTEAPVPEVREGYALLKIRRIGICGTDLHAFDGTQPFFTYPRILGHELSAVVVDNGGATEFKGGELVTIIPYFHCGHCVACRNGKTNCCVNIKVAGVHIDGGMVEYLSVPTTALVHGDGLSEDALALVEPLAIGAHAVRRAAVAPGEFVLVVGAGPIGLGIMEFARIAGATVIALDVNEQRLDFCRNELKVGHTINGMATDIKEQLAAITQGDMPGVVFDATGSLKAMNNSFQYIAHGGRYVLVGLQKEMISFSHPEFHKREATLMSSRNATRQDFEWVISALKGGWIGSASYINHCVMFDEVIENFPKWKDPANGVIKAMISINPD